MAIPSSPYNYGNSETHWTVKRSEQQVPTGNDHAMREHFQKIKEITKDDINWKMTEDQFVKAMRVPKYRKKTYDTLKELGKWKDGFTEKDFHRMMGFDPDWVKVEEGSETGLLPAVKDGGEALERAEQFRQELHPVAAPGYDPMTAEQKHWPKPEPPYATAAPLTEDEAERIGVEIRSHYPTDGGNRRETMEEIARRAENLGRETADFQRTTEEQWNAVADAAREGRAVGAESSRRQKERELATRMQQAAAVDYVWNKFIQPKTDDDKPMIDNSLTYGTDGWALDSELKRIRQEVANADALSAYARLTHGVDYRQLDEGQRDALKDELEGVMAGRMLERLVDSGAPRSVWEYYMRKTKNNLSMERVQDFITNLFGTDGEKAMRDIERGALMKYETDQRDNSWVGLAGGAAAGTALFADLAVMGTAMEAGAMTRGLGLAARGGLRPMSTMMAPGTRGTMMAMRDAILESTFGRATVQAAACLGHGYMTFGRLGAINTSLGMLADPNLKNRYGRLTGWGWLEELGSDAVRVADAYHREGVVGAQFAGLGSFTGGVASMAGRKAYARATANGLSRGEALAKAEKWSGGVRLGAGLPAEGAFFTIREAADWNEQHPDDPIGITDYDRWGAMAVHQAGLLGALKLLGWGQARGIEGARYEQTLGEYALRSGELLSRQGLDFTRDDWDALQEAGIGSFSKVDKSLLKSLLKRDGQYGTVYRRMMREHRLPATTLYKLRLVMEREATYMGFTTDKEGRVVASFSPMDFVHDVQLSYAVGGDGGYTVEAIGTRGEVMERRRFSERRKADEYRNRLLNLMAQNKARTVETALGISRETLGDAVRRYAERYGMGLQDAEELYNDWLDNREDATPQAQQMAEEVRRYMWRDVSQARGMVIDRLRREVQQATGIDVNEAMNKSWDTVSEEERKAIGQYEKALMEAHRMATSDPDIKWIEDNMDDETGSIRYGETRDGRRVTVRGRGDMVALTDETGQTWLDAAKNVTMAEEIPVEEYMARLRAASQGGKAEDGALAEKPNQQGEVTWTNEAFSLHPKTHIEEPVRLNDSNSPTSTDNREALLGVNSSELRGKGTENNGIGQENGRENAENQRVRVFDARSGEEMEGEMLGMGNEVGTRRVALDDGRVMDMPAEDVTAIEEQPKEEPARSGNEAATATADNVSAPDEPMPMRGGKPDWAAATPQRAWKYIYNETGLEVAEADQFVANKRDEAAKALANAQKRAPKIGTDIEQYRQQKAAWERQTADLARTVRFWDDVTDEQREVVAHEYAARREAEAAEDARRSERAEGGAHKAGKSITDRWNEARKVYGAEDEITLADGETIRGRYVLHEAGAATPSHNPDTWEPSDGFPVDENGDNVNTRNYYRDMDARRETQQQADDYDGRAWKNVPVVDGESGVTVSGNGRTIAGMIAARQGTDGKYLEHGRRYGSAYGFTPDDMAQFEHPRVSFVPNEALPLTPETFDKFNRDDKKTQSKTESSVKMGKVVADAPFRRILAIIDKFDSLADFYANDEATHKAIGELVEAGVIGRTELASIFDGDGLGTTGRELLENVLLGKAFERRPDALRQLTEYKSLRASIIQSLSAIVRNLALDGGFSVETELSNAIALVYEARKDGGYKAGEKVSGYARQLNLFGGDTVADPADMLTLLLADLINDGRTTLLRRALDGYNRSAELAASGQMDMFTGEVPSREETITDVLKLLNYDTKQAERAAAKPEGKAVAKASDDGRGSEGGRAGRGNGTSDERENNLSETKGYQLADEKDKFGNPFIVSNDGTTTFGEIHEDSGLQPAPIKLSLGENKVDENGHNHGYGLLHIEAGHGDQIRAAGFKSIQEFVESVARNYDTIRVGNSVADNQTYLLEVSDEHNNTLFIQLSRDGRYWNVNSAGIFKKKYSRNKTEVHTRPALEPETNTDFSGVDNGQTKGVTAPAGNSPQTSRGKDSNNSAEKQGNEQKNAENVRESSDEQLPASVDAKIKEERDMVETSPTEGQKQAGNYKKGHVKVDGYDVSIENPAGSKRSGVDGDGKPWEVTMNNDYGYIRGTEGVDGDHIDVFLSGNMEGWNGTVYVIDQVNPDGTFDEHKVMYGFNSEKDARDAYLSNYSEGWKGLGNITAVSREEFKQWVNSSHRKTKPFAEYKNVKKVQGGETDSPANTMDYMASRALKKRMEQKESELRRLMHNLGLSNVENFHVIYDPKELPAEEKEASLAIQNDDTDVVEGWYNPKTGQVYIYYPNIRNVERARQVILHELVAHKGVKDLLGREHFNDFCRSIYKSLSPAERDRWERYVLETAPGLEGDALHRAAADEYMAHLAERGIEQDVWKRFVATVREFLRTLPGFQDLELTDDDIRHMLQKSYDRLRELNEARSGLMEGEDRFSRKGKEKASEKSDANISNQNRGGANAKATAIQTESGAKIAKNLDMAKSAYEEKANRPRGFITDVAQALHLTTAGASKYGNFKAEDGKEFTLRISNHNASVSNFDERGESEGVSLVISRSRNNDIKNDGTAHIVEFFYPKKAIEKAEGKPLADIIGAIQELLRTGEYTDHTGLAQRQEVNMSPKTATIDDAIKFSIRVNHNSPYLLKKADGSFVDPETGERLGFDHRFMGSGEGAQAHGWGSYFSVKDLSEYANYRKVLYKGEVDLEGLYRGFVHPHDFPSIPPHAMDVLRMIGSAVAKGNYYDLEKFKDKLATYFGKDIDRYHARKDWTDKDYQDYFGGMSRKEVALHRASDEQRIADDEARLDFIRSLKAEDFNGLGEFSKHHYSVEIPDNDYYLEEDGVLSAEDNAILRSHLEKEILKRDEDGAYKGHENELVKELKTSFPNDITGRDVYGTVSAYLGGDEQASKFLKEVGFVGIHYDGRQDGECYVIFDENDAKIVDHVRFSRKDTNVLTRKGDEAPQASTTYEEGLANARRFGYSKRQYDAMLERQERNARISIANAISKLGLTDNVEVRDSADGLTGRKQTAKGWYDTETGKITIVLDNHHSLNDVMKTILHEGVAHYGLRDLFGEEFDEFLDKVYLFGDEEVRSKIAESARQGKMEVREATEEYLARLAEETDFENPASQEWWGKVKSWFVDMVRKFMMIYGSISDNELKYLLYRSYRRLEHQAKVDQQAKAEKDLQLQKKLKVGQYAEDVTTDGYWWNRKVSDESDNGIRFSRRPFAERQREAVERKGIVAPDLASKNVEVVEVPKHDFTGTGRQAIEKAKTWAGQHIVGEHEATDAGFRYEITEDVIDKFLSQSATKKSDNLGVHLAALKKLPEIIANSIDAEQHPDYMKVDGVRSAENPATDEMIVHRLYGAANIDGNVYRVKTTLHELKDEKKKAYSYEVTKIELLISGSTASDALSNSDLEPRGGLMKPSARNRNISAAKLLQGVEKSYDKGKKLLDESEDLTDLTLGSPETEQNGDENVRFSRVTDPQKLDELNKGKTIKVYRAMQLQDGKLYPPMSGMVDGKWQNAQEVGEWYQSDERPDLLDKNGKFVLKKNPQDSGMPVAYNPYWHTSRFPLNDQFASAWNRPELVTVEVEIPESELTSGYKAEGAKNAVGETTWKAGPVADKLYGTEDERKVILSRYNRLVRIVPDSEVAASAAKILKKHGLDVPFNVVTPSLRDELVKQGVTISEPTRHGSGVKSIPAYEEWMGGARFSRIKPVNDKFNEDLDKLTEDNADSVILSLGEPSAVLKRAGVVDKPMKLYGNKVIKKMKKHGFALADLHDLPMAVADPIAVFNNYGKEGNRSILTELHVNNGNVLVAVEMGKDGDVDFNIITSVFGKGNENLTDWLRRGLATYINEQKVKNFLSHQSAPIAATAAKSSPSDAAKIDEIGELNKLLGEKLYIRTQNFKDWFGDWENDPENSSKVVDENGEPMVVYHGTNSDFTEFDILQSGKTTNNKGIFGNGFYLSNSNKLASQYIGKGRPNYTEGVGGIMPLYANIRNPFYWNGKDAVKTARELGFPQSRIQKGKMLPLTEEKQILKFTQSLKNAGYDGVVYEYDANDDGTHWQEIVAFSPNQIKSATSNNGDFSAANNDIRYSRRPPFAPLSDEELAERERERRDYDGRIGRIATWREMKDIAADVAYDPNLTTEEKAAVVAKAQQRWNEVSRGEHVTDIKAEAERQQEEMRRREADALSQEADALYRAANGIRLGSTPEDLITQVHNFVAERLNAATGTGLGARGIKALLEQIDESRTSKDLLDSLNQIRATLNKAELKTVMEDLLHTLATKTQSQTRQGLATGVQVDAFTHQLMEDIRGSFKQLVASGLDEEIAAVGRQLRDLNKQYGYRTAEDGINARDAEFMAAREELMQRKAKLQEQKSDIGQQKAVESYDALEARFGTILDEMNQYRERGEEIPESLVQERIALPVRKRLAELRAQMGELESTESERDDILTRQMKGTRGNERRELQAKADALRDEMVRMQRRAVLLSREIDNSLHDILGEGRERRSELVRRQIEEENRLVVTAIRAVKKNPVEQRNQPHGAVDHADGHAWTPAERMTATLAETMKRWGRSAKKMLDIYNAPIWSFDFLVKYIDENHHIGEGPLYRMLMTGKDGAVEAHDRYAEGLAEYGRAIDTKAQELFGKDFEHLLEESRERTYETLTLTKHDAVTGETWLEPVEVTKGQALYIWLASRQAAGREKLEDDGWTKEQVEGLERMLGKRWLEFGRWITDEYLPELRAGRYNPTYEKLHGTPMHLTLHYFPLRIWQKNVHEKGEIGEGGNPTALPSTAASNLIVRQKNALPLDTDVNALDVLVEYGRKMERWNALAPLTQKLNVLMHCNAFRNHMEANHGKGFFRERWLPACEVVTDSYTAEEPSGFGQIVGRLQNSFLKGAIGFRWYTALKQVLSYPFFAAYSTNPRFQADLARNVTRGVDNYRWAMEHLPAFRQRVATGDMGIEGLTEEGLLGKLGTAISEKGMWANKKVDALTVAAGARAVYDLEMRRGSKMGLTDEEAERRAVTLAETCFNGSQQSSRAEFSSPMQKNRDLLSRSTTAFQNSNIAYRRIELEGMLDILRAKHVYDQQMGRIALGKPEEGGPADETEARRQRNEAYSRGIRKMLISVLIGAGLWQMGGKAGQWYSYLTSPDDEDDEKKRKLKEATAGDLVANLMLGALSNGSSLGPTAQSLYSMYNSIMEGGQGASGNELNPLQSVTLAGDVFAEAIRAHQQAEKEGGSATADIAMGLMTQWLPRLTGINPETWANITLGVADAVKRGRPELADAMFILNMPASQRKAIVERNAMRDAPADYMRQMMEASRIYEPTDWRSSDWMPATREITDKKRKELLQEYLDARSPEFKRLADTVKAIDKAIGARVKEIETELEESGRTEKAALIRARATEDVFRATKWELDENTYKRLKNNKAGTTVRVTASSGRKEVDETLLQRHARLMKECQAAAADVEQHPDALNEAVARLLELEERIVKNR